MLVRILGLTMLSTVAATSALAFDCPTCEDNVAGDVNGDDNVDIGDMIALGDYLFNGGDTPCRGADVNGDGRIDIADYIYLVDYLWNGGAAPVDPLC